MRLFLKPVIAALALSAVVLPPAVADMYTWKDPQTGRTRMSNIPPQWVRDNAPGPKVEVIRGNQVITPAAAFAKPQPPAELSARQRAAAGLPAQDKPAAASKASKPGDEDDD